MFYRIVFIALFYPLSLLSASLEQLYTFENPVIYSTDMMPECPKRFEVLQIPEGKTSFRINAQVIAKTFELNGCTIETGSVRFVTFSKLSNVDLTPIKEQLANYFTSHYPTMKIDKINVYPRGYIASLPHNATAVFDEDLHKSKEGTFYVTDEHGIRRYFDYLLDATIDVLYSTQKISRREAISPSNTQLKRIVFDSFRGVPLVAYPKTSHRFRSSIREDTPIIDRNIEPLPIVLKGSKVNVQVQNGQVIAEFIATATQEGALYDIITIQKADGKRQRAKIIGENRVEMQ